MTTNGTPPLLPGQSYYLGVRNSGAHAVTVVVEVDYDITALTNGAPFSGVLTTNDRCGALFRLRRVSQRL